MKWKAGLSIVTVMLLVGGCGGGGGKRPPPVSEPAPPPSSGGDHYTPPTTLGPSCEAGADRANARGGIWVGNPIENEPDEMRLLVAETGEFHWISPTGFDQKIFGTFRPSTRGLESDDATWVWVFGLTWLETEYSAADLNGELDEELNLSLDYETYLTAPQRGTLEFSACNSVYARGASPESIAGTYVDGDMLLDVNKQGEIYLQDRTCVGSGTVEPIDPNYNMYRMELVVSSCAESEVYAIGSTFSGLAYLGDSGPRFTGDLLEYSLTAVSDQRNLIWTRRLRR